jgi:transposase
MTLITLDEKRKIIQNKIIIGIDPANDKHQGFIIDEYGISLGKSFSFANNNIGITKTLWTKIKQRIEPDRINPQNIIFAIESSIDFWQILTNYLCRQGYKVALVSPLTTKKTRALPGNDFSRTDPKDARMIAENTAKGYFHWYRNESPREKAMKTLSLTYNKFRQDLQANQLRLRSQVKRIFPELIQSVTLNTETALFLISKYLYPQEYLEMDIKSVTKEILKISARQYDVNTLLEIQKNAKISIGIPKSLDEQIADKITITTIITMIKILKKQLKEISKQLIKFAKDNPYLKIITSLKGISDLTAAIFLAEIQNPNIYKHYKQIQKMAGLNLRLNVSGNGRFYYKINRIGNSRLRWVIYQMTKETSKYIPEVRIKYLKRQISKACYTKNIIASSSQLLQLLWCLIKNNRQYEYHEETLTFMLDLEVQYNRKNKKYKTKKNKALAFA